MYEVFINYISLLGVAYLIARRTEKTGSLFQGWGIGMIMLFWTYLIPNEIISDIQIEIGKLINKYLHIDTQTDWLGYFLCVIIGIVISILFILIEKILIFEHQYIADPFINFFKRMQSLFKKEEKKIKTYEKI